MWPGCNHTVNGGENEALENITLEKEVCQSFQHRAWIAVDLGSQNQSLRSKQKTNEGGNLLKIVFMDSSNQASEDLAGNLEIIAISLKGGL